ncbi:MAG: translational GTPase TypA, partial [Alcanivoracaceae bacterium]|nr:translational GTPase TypA [Alcanivoracaceae bacterium]
QLDFPVVYTSAINGIAGLSPDNMASDMTPLFEAIVEKVKAPDVDLDGSFQMQISSLDYNSYLGMIGIGRIKRGKIKANSPVKVIDREGKTRNGRLLTIMGHHGLERVEVPEATAGDIICITGLDPLDISDTICDPNNVEALPPLTVDEPTVSMTFQVNTSPFAGQEGKYVTSRNIRDRLHEELKHNVALRVEDTDSPDRFRVSGRGELHLSVLIETMRRENFELAVGRPEVIIKEVDGVKQEPYENLVIDIEEQHQGPVMEQLGIRRGVMSNMEPDGKGRLRLEYLAPSRGLIGFRSLFMTLTSGSGILNSTFSHYGDFREGKVAERVNGVLISNVAGKVLAYALFSLQERGRLFIDPNVEVYEGQLIGIHSRDNDLVVNPTKAKQLTNIRAAGSDENIILTPPIRMSLEQALDFIEDDELVEVTPKSIRLRKKLLTESERKRAGRA